MTEHLIQDMIDDKEMVGMHNEFTAVIERDDEWFIAYSPEGPGANGQGRSKHVPAEVCAVCGDVLLKPETVREIEALLDSATQPTTTVPLYEFVTSGIEA